MILFKHAAVLMTKILLSISNIEMVLCIKLLCENQPTLPVQHCQLNQVYLQNMHETCGLIRTFCFWYNVDMNEI